MKIYIFSQTKPKDYSALRIKEEFLKKDIACQTFQYSQIWFQSNSHRLSVGDFDFCLLRLGITRNPTLKMIVKYFKDKVLLNKKIMHRPLFWQDKLNQGSFFKKNRFPTPEVEPASIKTAQKKKFPFVLKKRVSSRGVGSYLVEDQKSWKEIRENVALKDYFIQEYIPVKKDIRILVLGNEIIGAVERKVRLKKTQGGNQFRVKVLGLIPVAEEIKKEALRIAKLLQCQLLGVDLLIDQQDRHYFLEVNFSPQFTAFEDRSGINVAEKLVDYLLDQIRKQVSQPSY